MRRTPVVIAAAVLLLVIAAVASAGPRDAELGRIAAEGPVTLSSNHPGRALLHAEHIMPGDSVTGLVSLSNKGDQPGALVLGVTGKRDRPGAYGGRLSRVLRLKIEDLSGKARTRESVVERASTFPLGTLSGRETRTYRVTATFPDGGRPVSQFAGDNLLQGSSVEVGLQWQLTAAGPVPTAVPGGPPATPGPTVLPTNPPSGRRPLLVTLRVPKQRVLKPRGLKAYAECEIACKVRFSARTDNAPVKKKGKKKAAKRKTLQKKKVLKGERKWRKLRAGREQRVFLKMQPKARKKLKRRLRTHGRVGITVIVHMRSAAGNRTAKRRIVMRTYKKGERRR